MLRSIALLALCSLAPAQTIGNYNLMPGAAIVDVISWNGRPALVLVNRFGDVCAFAQPSIGNLVAVRLDMQAALVLDSRGCTWGGQLDLSYSDTHTPRTGLTMPAGGMLYRGTPWGYPMKYQTSQPVRTHWYWSYCGHTGRENSCNPEVCQPEWNAVVCYVSLN